MPALAGLLMVVGFRTIKPDDIKAVWKTGTMQATVMTVTFVLTMLIPLQYAVLVGVGISMILYIIKQSNRIIIQRWLVSEDGDLREVDAPQNVPPNEVVLLQPYGSLFFASAPVFEAELPNVTDETHDSVVVLRLRGRHDLGSTFMEVLAHYAQELRDHDSKLMLVSASETILRQLDVSPALAIVGSQNIYESDEWVGRTIKQAYHDGIEWIENKPEDDADPIDPEPSDDD
jgi:SulP family sulfate permease